MKKAESIARPRTIRGLEDLDAICIPYDPAPGTLLAHLEKTSSTEIRLSGSRLFFLPGKVVLHQCLGAPAAVATLETLIASGISSVLLLSFCGSLDPKFRIGDVLSVSAAYSDEGTSRHYLSGRRTFKPASSLRRKAESRLAELRLPFKRAECVSTDAPYRETKAWVRSMTERNLGAVDMEAAAVFALAEFHGLEAAAVFVVTDEVFSGSWEICSSPDLLKKKIRGYFLPFL